MTESKICTCPSGDGSLRWPCPAHPAVEQAGGDERAAFEQWLEQHMSHHFSPEFDLAKYEDSGEYRYNPAADYWKAWQARAALAQPSPKSGDYSDQSWINAGCPPEQPEQAEAERPEMSPERAAYFMRRFKSEEKLLGPNEQAAVDYVLSLLAQHDRIVGALRADRDSWAEQAEQRLADWDEMRKERDAALARVEQQERTIAGMNEAHAKLAGLYEAAQAQHSVPELLEWAVGRWHAEVSLRPLINVHRRALDDTWRQVIRRLGGDTGLLCGPSHDELLAAAPAQGGE